MKILMVGDIVGAPGRKAMAQVVARMRREGQVDFVVANAENAAGGRGLTRALGEELLAAGANVLTLGDHTWDQKDLPPYLNVETRLVRPANFAPTCPGRGFTNVDTDWGRITVISLVGRVFMPPYDCPFRAADAILGREPKLGRIVLVDLHGEATSEKIAMGRYLDGRVTAVVGTHTHVQTSDETLLPKGTAYLTDLGMTGPKDSIIGRELESVMSTFLTGMPSKFEIAERGVVLEGCLLDVNEQNGRARRITRVREWLDEGR